MLVDGHIVTKTAAAPDEHATPGRPTRDALALIAESSDEELPEPLNGCGVIIYKLMKHYTPNTVNTQKCR